MPEPQGLTASILAVARRALGVNPPRVAAVQLGPMAGIDFTKTTGYDAKTARAMRAAQISGIWGGDPWEQTRLQRYRDYREIAEEVPELARALEVMIDFVFGGSDLSFELKYSKRARPEVIRICDAAVADLDMHRTVRGISHEGLWLGDSWTELIYSSAPTQLIAQRSLRPELVSVMQDEFGYLHSYDLAIDGGYETRALVPFQVIHYAPGVVRGARYGRSLFHSARGLRRKHEAVDDVTAMLTLRKAAGDTYFLWPFPPNVTQAETEDWIRGVQESVDDESFFDSSGQLRRRVAALLDTVPKILPFRLQRDIDTKPTVVETKPADLAQLVEVLKYLQDRFFVATGVPKALVGLERDVNSRSTLEQQGIHFALTVHTHQRAAARVTADMLIRACLVAGVVPEPDEFEILMAKSSAFDESMRADVFAKRAGGVQALTQGGTPTKFALKLAFPELTEEMLDEISDAIDTQRDANAEVQQDVVQKAVEVAVEALARIVVRPGDRMDQRENSRPDELPVLPAA